MSGIQNVKEIVIKGKRKLIKEAVEAALNEGCEPMDILNDGMISAMDIVGARFSEGLIYVPQMLAAAKAMQKA